MNKEVQTLMQEVEVPEAQVSRYRGIESAQPARVRKAKHRPKEFRQNVAIAKLGMTKGIQTHVDGKDYVTLPASIFLQVAQTLDMI